MGVERNNAVRGPSVRVRIFSQTRCTSTILTYRVCDRSDSRIQAVSKRVRCYQKFVNVQKKSLKFDGKYPIVLLNFLAMFQMAYDFNEIHEGATK